MTTGYSTVENAVKSLYSGAIDFIPKPFTTDELLSSVYRGLKYGEIQNRILSDQSGEKGHSLIYVPCPAKYYRLGYASWLSVEREGSVKLGVTDMFLRTIENISSVTLIETDNEIIQGSSCAQIKSENEVINYVLAPVSGRIIESNEELLHNMSILEKDPYFKGWIYRLIPTDIEYQLKHLTPCSSDRI
jgi:glycine cleavage system H protein